MIFRVEHGSHVEVVWDTRTSLRLGRELRSGELSRGAIDRTVRVARDFRALIDGLDAERIIAVATSAVREVANGAELIKRVRDEAQIELVVISGEDEAKFAFFGAVYGLPVDDGMLIDLGGGSLEITRFADRTLLESWTLPLGALRVSDDFLLSDPPSAKELKALGVYVRDSLEAAGIPRLGDHEVLVGTGGTIRNLAKMERERSPSPVHRLHGAVVGAASIASFAAATAALPLAERSTIDGLNADRADSIVGGSIVVDRLLRWTKAPELLVSGAGVREGVLLAEAFDDRLPGSEQVRRTAVFALAGRFAGFAPASAADRGRVAVGLLEAIYGDEVPVEVHEMIEHASSLLDVGRATDYYNRHEHTADVVLGADLAGFTHRNLAMLSATIRSAGRDGISLRSYRALLSEDDRQWVLRSGIALAIAEEIEVRLAGGEVGSITWKVDGDAVRPLGPDLTAWRPKSLVGRCKRVLGVRLSLT